MKSTIGRGLFKLAVLQVLAASVLTGALATENPILIPGVQEPAEMRVKPLPSRRVDLTAPEQALGEVLKSNNDPRDALPALNRILSTYPEYADAYAMHAMALCEGNDRAAALSDLNNAIKFIGAARFTKGSLASLLSMRARLEHSLGDDRAALDDLDRVVAFDPTEADRFTNSGAVAPEATANMCTWTQTDMDAIVQRFPADYRSYLFRGLYFAFFVTFGWEGTKPAIDDLTKAVGMNSTSPLPNFLRAHELHRMFFLKQYYRMSEAQRADWYNMRLDDLNKALARDPNFLPALKERATTYFSLKQFGRAIADYDRVLALDPKDSVDYNDRGLAKSELGDSYGAIMDLTKAIQLKERELQHSSSYENRAEAYMKTRQWDRAIADLTTAISLQVGGVAFSLVNVDQFRDIYPEYKNVPSDVLARKLNQTFFPDLKYEDFSDSFLKPKQRFSSSVLTDLYLKRLDAYLKSGNWAQAAREFTRLVSGFPDDANSVDRWREVGRSTNTRIYIDMKTFNAHRLDAVKLWIKQVPSDVGDADGPYSVQQFELNCPAVQIRAGSFASYNAEGKLTGGREGGGWDAIVPDTIGETLFGGACRSH